MDVYRLRTHWFASLRTKPRRVRSISDSILSVEKNRSSPHHSSSLLKPHLIYMQKLNRLLISLCSQTRLFNIT